MKLPILIILSLFATSIFADTEMEEQRKIYMAAKSRCRGEAQQAVGPRPQRPNLYAMSPFERGYAKGEYARYTRQWKAEREQVFNECMAGEGF